MVSLAYRIKRRTIKKKSVRDFCIAHGGFWYWCHKRYTGFWVYRNTQGRSLNVDPPQSLARSLKTYSQQRRLVRIRRKR